MKINFSRRTLKRLNQELIISQKLNNLRFYKITKSLLLVAEQTDKELICQLFDISLKTLYNWITKFIAQSFSWLLGHHFQGRGCKSKLSKQQKSRLYDIVTNGPEAAGFDCGIWNSAMIAEVIQREFKVCYNPRYVCRLLKSIGLTYQKATFISDHLDENKREEWVQNTWPEILNQAKEKNAVILFEDEVSFAQWGSLARTWAQKGKQPKIKTTGIRKGLKIFGAIELFNGSFHYMESNEKFNGDSYIEFLNKLLNSYSQPVILVEDGAPYHKSKIVNEFKEKMKAQERLVVYRLPSYSPDYNPIEKLWKNTKKNATHCKYFKTFDDLRASVVRAFNKYMIDATKVICVMKKLRTDAGIC